MWEQIGVSFLQKVFTEIWDWIRRRSSRDGIRIETIREHGPISREHGFTETAIKITVVNETESTVKFEISASCSAVHSEHRWHKERRWDVNTLNSL